METTSFDFWMFAAGLGIFLFGMHHLEHGLKGLTGKAFKKLLQRFTNKSWKGIITGTVVTAILQSSSMVTLLVLAFLGGGMIGLKNSLGVVLGANLGTTFTAWMVAALGFKMNIADFSFPFLAVGILSYLFFNSRPILKSLGGFLVGFGLLFLGLDYMKDSIESIATQVDMAEIASYDLWAFLLVGLVITALLQSSSALIVIILSALNAQLIDIYQAVAMIIGANVGTTATMLIGSLGGTADKKRLALAHLIFNLVAGVSIFFFIQKLVDFTYSIFGISDPLMELVLLNSLINLYGILLFYPFLKPFTKFLKSLFAKAVPQGETLFIKNIPPEVPDVAIKALDKELNQIFLYTKAFILDCFQIRPKDKNRESRWKKIFSSATNLTKKYEKIKRLEDELTVYYAQLQEKNLSIEEARQLTASMMGLRSMIYGAKDVKDVMHNISFILDSDDKLGTEILKRSGNHINIRLEEIHKFINDEAVDPELKTGLATMWLKENEDFYNKTISYLYEHLSHRRKNAVPVSTLTNVIQQTHSSIDNLYSSIIYWKLEKGTTLDNSETVKQKTEVRS
ncbi:Na/Pi symporter [Salegentibacter sp. JZCK2]|uniref:Na/Pi cotransporter family protein n=1 Tax=Salegentibacter tibetensis TaxID=2873600 RepID=UPI001CCB8885|nr:Na/Pi symporter [Salegentibacter tibetensis]MBZ9729977.1 Na/Pi symporter [Salegentibacter tibetensis]